MLVCAVMTAFRYPRWYRETLAGAMGDMVLCLWGIRLVVRGSPPSQGQVVYISNHTSTIDMFALIALRLPNTRFFLSGYLRKLLPLGLIGYLIGIFWTVPQAFPEKRRRIFSAAAKTLRRSGESVYLSPEGERVTTGRMGHFNKGAFHLATSLRAPLVPLYLHVPREINPGKGLNARAGTVEAFFRSQIATSDWREQDVEINRDRMRDFYVRWHDEISRS